MPIARMPKEMKTESWKMIEREEIMGGKGWTAIRRRSLGVKRLELR